ITGGPTLNLSSSQQLQSLSIASGASARVTTAKSWLELRSLSLATAAALDLNDNDLVVSYDASPNPFTEIRGWVFNGYSSVPDSGKTGVISTVGQSAGNTILALFDNA